MPVHVFYGPEEYLRTRAVRSFCEDRVPPEMAAFGYSRLEKPGIADVMEAAGRVTLSLGGASVVEIRNFPALEKALNEQDEKMLEPLKAVLGEDLPENRFLVFVSAKIDKKIKLVKWLTQQKQVTFHEFAELPFWKADEAVARLVSEAKREGILIKPPAAAMLVESYGFALQPLMSEAKKLAVYTGSERPIDRADVMALCLCHENVFQLLSDWVLEANRSGVYASLAELLLHQHPVQLFALTQTFLDNIVRFRLWEARGVSPAEMAERSNKKPFSINKDLNKFRRVPLPRLLHLKNTLMTMEWKAKTGQLESRLALEALLAA